MYLMLVLFFYYYLFSVFQSTYCFHAFKTIFVNIKRMNNIYFYLCCKMQQTKHIKFPKVVKFHYSRTQAITKLTSVDSGTLLCKKILNSEKDILLFQSFQNAVYYGQLLGWTGRPQPHSPPHGGAIHDVQPRSDTEVRQRLRHETLPHHGTLSRSRFLLGLTFILMHLL